MVFRVSCWLHLKWNPHPCGYWGNSGEIGARMCRCSVRQIEYYRKRISGPLLDRIDIHVDLTPKNRTLDEQSFCDYVRVFLFGSDGIGNSAILAPKI
jgi:predicted ATPase with chaperone activity